MRQSLTTLILALSLTASSAAQGVLDRFLTREDTPLSDYAAFRRLEARNERFKVSGWLEACVDYSAARGLSFRVIGEGGSGYIRGKVLRKALEGERDMVARGDPGRATLSLANYRIVAEEQNQLGEAALRLLPRRQDLLLVSGHAVVTDPEADLLRVEGRLTKTPSYWTRSVDVTRRYERHAGVRVPVELVSTADVRLAGRSHFRTGYEYLTINGTPLSPPPDSRALSCLVTQN